MFDLRVIIQYRLKMHGATLCGTTKQCNKKYIYINLDLSVLLNIYIYM